MFESVRDMFEEGNATFEEGNDQFKSVRERCDMVFNRPTRSNRGQDLAEEVRQYFIPDFSNWKNHDDFERSFDRLLRDLKAEGTIRAH
jgi:hypothetical protein